MFEIGSRSWLQNFLSENVFQILFRYYYYYARLNPIVSKIICRLVIVQQSTNKRIAELGSRAEYLPNDFVIVKWGISPILTMNADDSQRRREHITVYFLIIRMRKRWNNNNNSSIGWKLSIDWIELQNKLTNEREYNRCVQFRR